MKRALLALVLVFAASGALAAEAEPAEAAPAGCPKAEAVQEKTAPSDNATAAARPGTPAPVRPRASAGNRGAPRWHSLVPGMFR